MVFIISLVSRRQPNGIEKVMGWTTGLLLKMVSHLPLREISRRPKLLQHQRLSCPSIQKNIKLFHCCFIKLNIIHFCRRIHCNDIRLQCDEIKFYIIYLQFNQHRWLLLKEDGGRRWVEMWHHLWIIEMKAFVHWITIWMNIRSRSRVFIQSFG